MSASFINSRCISITTKYIGASATKPSRVKATASNGISLTLSWEHADNIFDNHAQAARALCEKMDWAGDWVGGESRTSTGYHFVAISK